MVTTLCLVALLGTTASFPQRDALKDKTLVGGAESVPILTLPSYAERIQILGVALVLFGGLALLLNEKRKRADRNSWSI